MKQYQCVLFDLDGTLANTYQGIFNCYQYAAKQMGLELPTEKLVHEAIGAPLTNVFREKFGLDQEKVEEATKWNRIRYAEKGIYEVNSYPKMEEVLKQLKEKGIWLGVATLKKEEFAKEILSMLGLDKYLDVIVGMDAKDKRTKAEMIKRALSMGGQSIDNAVLVGDSFYDALGADEANIDFIGVTYGFGFQNVEDISKYKYVACIDYTEELLNFI